MKIIIFILLCYSSILFAEANETLPLEKSMLENKNIWIKTYINNKSYKTIINNIVKIEQKIKKEKNTLLLNNLNSRLILNKSKLELYERNKSFESLLLYFKFEATEITMRDYIFKNSEKKLDKIIDEYILLKNKFYMAISILKNNFKKESDKKKQVLASDINYFEEFSENIDKTYINLIEARDELNEKYAQYKREKLQKHILTITIIGISYLVYKILSFLLLYIERKLNKDVNQNNYKKILSLLFFVLIFVFLVGRYIDDFIYMITFLSVVAAALTLALREVILNIAAAIYIFFSNMIRIGDRIMIQYETKHTIGDILDISLMKIKLNEIEDYSNVKEVRNVGRTTYIPNSYVFTKVFYNYSRKKDGLINDLIEFEFSPTSDFNEVENITQNILEELGIDHTITFTLNNLKTGVVGLISYKTNYKEASKIRGNISIKLFQAYSESININMKSSKLSTKLKSDEE